MRPFGSRYRQSDDDEGFLITSMMANQPVTQRGTHFPLGGCSPLFYQENTMQQHIPSATVHAAEHAPFADLFPHTSSLERMLLEHTFNKAAAVLCDDDWFNRWQYRKVSDSIAYVVPARSDFAVFNVETTDFTGKVSADAFGLMVTLNVLGYLTALMESDGYAARIYALRKYALQHPQAQYIRAALGLEGERDAKS
nr:antirestriction protein [Xenorhabdus sp. BG5]